MSYDEEPEEEHSECKRAYGTLENQLSQVTEERDKEIYKLRIRRERIKNLWSDEVNQLSKERDEHKSRAEKAQLDLVNMGSRALEFQKIARRLYKHVKDLRDFVNDFGNDGLTPQHLKGRARALLSQTNPVRKP